MNKDANAVKYLLEKDASLVNYQDRQVVKSKNYPEGYYHISYLILLFVADSSISIVMYG